MRRHTYTRAAVIISVLGLALTLAACGSSGKKTTTTTASSAAKQSAAAVTAQSTALAKLPTPQAGVINIADGESLGITPAVITAYEKTNPGVSVTPSPASTAQAFGELCTGKADIAEVTQAPSASEVAECAANGITFQTNAEGDPEAITLAADGIVVATKNDQNVGGDCLRRQTVRDIFEPGSTIDNWAQLGFDDLPLTTAGRGPDLVPQDGSTIDTGTFPLFANLVLGVEGDESLDDVRSDFEAFGTDTALRNKVTGAGLVARIIREENALIASRLRGARTEIAAEVAAAEAKANKPILAEIRAANLARAKKKIVLTAAQAAAITATNAKLDSQVQSAAGAKAYAAAVSKIHLGVIRLYAAQLARAENPGVLGVFRFTYYELYEDKLRPMEIWDPVSSVQELQDEGVATNESRAGDKITISTRQQAGGGTGQVETVVIPSTPTKPGTEYTSDSKQTLTVPAGGPVNVDTTPNCIFPSRQTITSGVYPLSIQLLAYVPKRELKRADVKNYLAYYLGVGQQTVDSQRLVPIDQETREEEYKDVTGKNLPTSLLAYGNTPAGGSVQGVSGESSAATSDISGGSGASAGSSAAADTTTSAGQSTNAGVG